MKPVQPHTHDHHLLLWPRVHILPPLTPGRLPSTYLQHTHFEHSSNYGVCYPDRDKVVVIGAR
jgi:hypothetical protein